MRTSVYITTICTFLLLTLFARGELFVERSNQMQDSVIQVPDSAMQVPDSVSQDSMRRERFVIDTMFSKNLQDSAIAFWDSFFGESLTPDSTSVDTIPRPPRKPFLDAPVFLKFQDSLIYEPGTKDMYIHKQGDVKYQDKEVTADFMKFNTGTKLVFARGIMDTVEGKMTRTKFTENDASYDMDSMAYNMTSGKALIHGVNTKEGEGILFGGTVKKMKDNVVHMHNGRYTTCDAECPHFYLQMTKGTVVPGKQTVFGPAYMVFEDVPLYPLMIPFGFFPQKTKRNSGIIIPEIGEERIKGFFLRDGGYYFAINDYVDLRLTAGIYTLGSWDAALGSSYAKRYTFRGDFSFNFAKDIIGEFGSPDYINTQGINIRWTHQQDPKFRPSSTFSASVNYMNNSSYNKYNADNMQDYLSSQTSSTIAYSKNWSGLPLSLSINASHSQNTLDSTISVSLPTFVFNVSRISPFKRRNAVGKERWYEKISFTYNMDFQNRVENIKEKDFFQDKMWDAMRTGFNHQIPVSASFNLFGALNITPSFSYTERWYFNGVNQNWDSQTESIISDTTSGFYRVYNYSASISMNTKLYGTYVLGKEKNGKKPVIIRHVFTPRISGSWAPDFGKESYGFWKTVQSDKQGNTRLYSPFSNGLFGTAPQGQNASISFGVDNTLEAKIPSDKDTTGQRKITIIEGLSINSSYNFLAKEFKLQPFAVSLRVPIVKGYTLNLSGTLDPYAIEDGRRVNRFLVKEGGFLRLTALSFSVGYGFKSKASPQGSGSGRPAINNPTNNRNGQNFNEQIQSDFFTEQAQQQQSQVERARLAAAEYYDFNIPWSVNLNYTFSYSNPTGKSNLLQTVNASASVNLTPKWGVSFSAGYDFSMKKLTPGTVQITRDLHCWQMSFSWVPVGFRQSWSFTIQAKSSMLADLLKYKKNNSFLDNYYYNY